MYATYTVRWRRVRTVGTAAVLFVAAFGRPGASSEPPDVTRIVQRWTAANRADFDAALNYDCFVRIRSESGSKTYHVTMLFGTPYKRLVAEDGKPLNAARQREEEDKFARERRERAGESPHAHARRLDDYRHGRERAHRLLEEMPRAFAYRLVARRQIRSRTVYVLRATPLSGYDPPTTEAEVLTGMRGEFWIDAMTYQLVRATAIVLRPVSIAGFLATVEPGTRFELEQQPVSDGVWLPAHLEIRSRSSIVHLFDHHHDEERTYFGYRRTTPP